LCRDASWLATIIATAFGVALVFSDLLLWPRSLYLLPYVLIVGGLSFMYLRRVGFTLRDLTHNWPAGIAVAAAASYFVIGSLDRFPISARPEGVALAVSLAWVGVIYGLVDALPLNVLPVLLARDLVTLDNRAPWLNGTVRGLVALAISSGGALVYHLGYSEYRGAGMIAPVLGNALITATFVVSGSPLAPLVTHVAMHIAAVLHGMETVPQLPPHY
jgi:hypothetical protein